MRFRNYSVAKKQLGYLKSRERVHKKGSIKKGLIILKKRIQSSSDATVINFGFQITHLQHTACVEPGKYSA